MIKAVIFDMDGLIIDSETSTWPKVLSEFLLSKGIVLTDEAREEARGAGHKETIKIFKEKLGLEGNTDSLIAQMRSCFFKTFLQDPVLAVGIKEFLEDLSKKDYILAIATGLGPENEVINLLLKLDLKKYFKEVVTGDEVTKGKPDPQIYLITAQKIKVKPQDCLALEDAVNGVLSGKAAGMKVFGVNQDEKIKESLINAGADKVFSSLLEIKEL